MAVSPLQTSQSFPKFCKISQKHPTASECIRMYRNVSEQVWTGPNRKASKPLKHVCKQFAIVSFVCSIRIRFEFAKRNHPKQMPKCDSFQKSNPSRRTNAFPNICKTSQSFECLWTCPIEFKQVQTRPKNPPTKLWKTSENIRKILFKSKNVHDRLFRVA